METVLNFDSWDRIMILGASAFIGIAVIILLYHEFRIFQIKDYKKKYDYVNLHEVRYFWYAVMAVIAAVALYSNTIATDTITSTGNMMWFYVRLFITVSFTVIAYFVFYSMVRIYYPRSVEKRLNKLRNTPRISPAGNIMRKLSEEEEDVHLEPSQIAEEHGGVHSVDYDVWIDEQTGQKIVEKYLSYQHVIECPECGYVTLRIYREEVDKAPTESEPGLLAKHYKCGYCNHRELREVSIAKLSANVV
jgi:hypothetical protein